GTQRYYVVHFVKENTVEVVPEQCVEKRYGVLCCYWPRNASATMIKRGDQPDKILLEKYRISIFSSTDNYSVAEQQAKRWVDTSNVESDEEPAKRAVTKPIRFRMMMEVKHSRKRQMNPDKPSFQCPSFHQPLVIRYLTLCCGLDLGSGIRRIMREI
ncbi:unnamed protein product, partial [Coregonus sp. 'balchen']